ncbi:hypothetical protein Naga_100010g84 [Nannochloropsis gaditana]|uniref:Uncharacterized protein n=1 Tax=Nannochloropsis gaditana TaxID=72520 RepID=W7TUF0_9STRA|nr:hypothetical protein Naga_100010g84 [Nannochloropsis gaditana]
MVISAAEQNSMKLVKTRKRHVDFRRELVLREEHVFYHELVKMVPKLASLRRMLDDSVLSKLVGKSRSLEDSLPDYYHLNEATNIALHGEFHEEED